MHHTADAIRAQRRFFHNQRRHSDCLGIFNLLTSDLLFDELESRRGHPALTLGLVYDPIICFTNFG